MKNNKLTKEEFDNITELTTKANLIQEQKNKLNEKYGSISIDLKDGSFVENEVVEENGK